MISDYLKVPEVTEEHEETLVEIQYDPLSCTRNGSCCFFEGKRYEYCGIYEVAGGRTAINAIDTCCRQHDIDIRGKKGIARCAPHRKFLDCTKGKKGPGDTTIRNGIRYDALDSGCGWML